MNIEEFRERVKLTPAEIIDLVTKYHLSGEKNRHILARRVAKAQLNKILNDPDLALIEECECGGEGYEEGGDGAPSWHVVCGKCMDTGRKVIPLAEALKGVEG